MGRRHKGKARQSDGFEGGELTTLAITEEDRAPSTENMKDGKEQEKEKHK
jgi:hypothetical protein